MSHYLIGYSKILAWGNDLNGNYILMAVLPDTFNTNVLSDYILFPLWKNSPLNSYEIVVELFPCEHY